MWHIFWTHDSYKIAAVAPTHTHTRDKFLKESLSLSPSVCLWRPVRLSISLSYNTTFTQLCCVPCGTTQQSLTRPEPSATPTDSPSGFCPGSALLWPLQLARQRKMPITSPSPPLSLEFPVTAASLEGGARVSTGSCTHRLGQVYTE